MTSNKQTLENIVTYATSKGFVYPSSEIYGGYAATYDFGPLGVLLKKNIENLWRYWNVTSRMDMEEIEGAIFMHPKTWEASGHIGGFSDLLVEDKVSHKRYRADHLLEEKGIMENAGALSCEQVDQLIKEHKILSPDGNPLSKAKKFNLLVKTHLGPVEDDSTLVYLKGESCQNIYLDWKQVQQTTRRKLPFGIAQIGKAFRNEITVKQFLFRTREFEQMDVQYFCHKDQADSLYGEWKAHQMNFFTGILKFDPVHLRLRQHEEDEKAFYALEAWDIEYQYGELGFKEVEGVHHRASYDLDQHSKFSGKDLSYFDDFAKERFNPYIIESSAGFSRIFLAVLFEFLQQEDISTDDKVDTRTVFKIPYSLAPYKIAVLPLMKKSGLDIKAKEITSQMKEVGLSCVYDETGSIGKRYRRQDEIGTPWCLTVDFETLENNTVTLRHRDTMEQVGQNGRLSLEEIPELLRADAFEEHS
jgi:glycyl-tRNA synthetase